MKYANLGKTDIKVSKVCVGCMSFGKAGSMHDWTLDEAASDRVIGHALDLGINFLIRPTAIQPERARNTWARQLKITHQETK